MKRKLAEKNEKLRWYKTMCMQQKEKIELRDAEVFKRY